jgi:hypothetical protein
MIDERRAVYVTSKNGHEWHFSERPLIKSPIHSLSPERTPEKTRDRRENIDVQPAGGEARISVSRIRAADRAKVLWAWVDWIGSEGRQNGGDAKWKRGSRPWTPGAVHRWIGRKAR